MKRAVKYVDYEAVKRDWEFFYWDPCKTNSRGESLLECLEKYGVGGWHALSDDMAVALIFLDHTKSAGHSWLLGLKRLNGEQASERQYESTSMRICPNQSLGLHIRDMLVESKFEAE